MVNVVKPAEGEVVRSGLASTVSEAGMRSLVQKKAVADTIINSILPNTESKGPIAGIAGLMPDKAVDEQPLYHMEEASTPGADDELSTARSLPCA